MTNYEVKLDLLRKSNIRPYIGKVLVLKLSGGTEIDAKVIKMEKDTLTLSSIAK